MAQNTLDENASYPKVGLMEVMGDEGASAKFHAILLARVSRGSASARTERERERERGR